MEMKINKTVNVEMDESLGYPIVFIKFDELKNNALAEAIKQKAWESLQQFMGTEQMPDAHKECHVLTHWLDKGYLCYPAYENYLAYRPYNCGPRYIKKINCILEKTDRHAWYEFWGVCENLTGQIADWLDGVVKDAAAAEAKKEAEQTEPQDASSEKLKKAVEKIHRKDIIWANGNVYFQTNCRQVLDTYPMKLLWISHCGLHNFPVVDIVTDPLMYGKILLTLPEAMGDAQTEYWSLLIDLVGRDNVKNAADAVDALCGAMRKTEEDIKSEKEPEQSDTNETSTEKLRKAVEKLNRRDVIFEQECVYLRTEGPRPGLVNTAPMANFLECAAGWDDSRSWHRFSMPLAEGKILLTPPTETEDGTNAYWNLLGTVVCEPIVREAKNIHDTLYEIMGKQSVLMAEKKIEQSASVGTPTPQEGQKEAVGEPKQSGPKARLKAAVDKLGRKDVTYEYGHVYYQLKKWPCGRSAPMTNLWIRKTGLDTSTIHFRCTSPLMDGKVLLNLPPEIVESEDAYWAILGDFIGPKDMEDIVEIQKTIRKAMEEQPAPKIEKPQKPLYFQTQPYTSQGDLVDNMRVLWQNNVRGLNMSSVEEAVLNPLYEGKISLLNDLPEVAAEFGTKYCGLLKYWLHPITWATFADTWNKIHPDTKV